MSVSENITFPSDIDLKKNPELGVICDPDPSQKSFLSHSSPYYKGGFRILHRCPEFRLIQDHGPSGNKRVEWNYDIYYRFLKSSLRVNTESNSKSNSWKDRVELACALNSLRSFYDANKEGLERLEYPACQHIDEQSAATPNGGLGCARILGATLGSQLSEVLEAEDPDQAIRDLTASFGVALRAVARSHGKLKDERTTGRPRPHDLIRVATEIYRAYEVRPVKEAIEFLLTDHYGFVIQGKNSAVAWSDLFIQAGLGDLPEVGRKQARATLSHQEKG